MSENVINGRYELLAELSHGGMGDVWRGCDAVMDRSVAVKLFAKRVRREGPFTVRIQHPVDLRGLGRTAAPPPLPTVLGATADLTDSDG